MPAGRRRLAARDAGEGVDALLDERARVMDVLDRVSTLRGASAQVQDVTGADAAFVADLAGDGPAVIRWMAGARSVTHDRPVTAEVLGALLAMPVTDAAGQIVALTYAGMRGDAGFGGVALENLRSFESRTGVPARLVELTALPELDADRTARCRRRPRGPGQRREARPRAGGPEVDARFSTGLGIRALTERAQALGGRASLVRDPEGATLRTWVPLPGDGTGP